MTPHWEVSLSYFLELKYNPLGYLTCIVKSAGYLHFITLVSGYN